MRTLGDAIDTSVWNVGFGQAGKNKIINGDFSINQRSFTSLTTSLTYGFDRWLFLGSDGTTTYSAQTFTAGAAPVAGYESTNFARLVTSGQTLTSAFSFLSQKIENVRTFANQTVTVSFWAKAATGTPKIAIELDQQFGSGGSTRVATAVGQVTISTGWTRYSASVLVPSISGKTIGTGNSLNANLIVSAGSDFNSRTGSLGIQSNTFDFWGVQVEAGSKVTPFQTATGTIQGELAACQRYYVRYTGGTGGTLSVLGTGTSTTNTAVTIPFGTIMRVIPTGIDFGNLGSSDLVNATINATSVTLNGNTTKEVAVVVLGHASGITQYRPYALIGQTSTVGYIGFTAEL